MSELRRWQTELCNIGVSVDGHDPIFHDLLVRARRFDRVGDGDRGAPGAPASQRE